jgi:hypothetical protein
MRPDDFDVARRFGLMLAALLLALVMSLASCGPGVVGTGDGNAPMPVADATVCNEDFGATLSCPVGTGSNVAVGTDDVTWSDADDQGAAATVGARFTGNNLALEQPCAGLRFDGRFTLLDDGRRAFAGSYVDAASRETKTGFVWVSLEDSATSRLRLQLVDADGVARHGPWVLRRDRTTPTFVACPSTTS